MDHKVFPSATTLLHYFLIVLELFIHIFGFKIKSKPNSLPDSFVYSNFCCHIYYLQIEDAILFYNLLGTWRSPEWSEVRARLDWEPCVSSGWPEVPLSVAGNQTSTRGFLKCKYGHFRPYCY